MQTSFNSAASPMSETERFLKEGHYTYGKRPDGMLLVQGNIDVARRGLKALPDLSRAIVTGNFYCQDNELTSLKGAPAETRGGFWCNNNKLESLEHAPEGVTGQYICHNNRLTALAHVPREIQGDFRCDGNPLPSLEGAPRKFHKLFTGWGDFDAWDKVPEALRTSPETKAHMADDAVVLRDDMRVSKPIAFRRP